MSVAMIWGAAGGIGQALATQLINNGWQVIAICHDTTKFVGDALCVLDADVADAVSVQQAVLATSFEVTAVDLWVYAVGDIVSAKVRELEPAGWQRILNANLTGAYLTTHYSRPLLADKSHLFYLGAVSERLQLPGLAAYAAAKAGLEAFTTSLNKEERQWRVTIVRPGAVATPFWDKVPMRLPKDAASPEKVARRIMKAYDNRETGRLDLT